MLVTPQEIAWPHLRCEFILTWPNHVSMHLEKVAIDDDAEKLIIIPGFEVIHAKQKRLTSIITWIKRFWCYVAVMAKSLPECIPGLMPVHDIMGVQGAGRPGLALLRGISVENGSYRNCSVGRLGQQLCGGQPHKRTPNPRVTKFGLFRGIT